MKNLSQELKQRLIKVRDKLLISNKNFGKIVYDTRNNVVGVGIGEMSYKDVDETRVLIVTPEKDTSGSRVRYSKPHHLKIVNDPEINITEVNKFELDVNLDEIISVILFVNLSISCLYFAEIQIQPSFVSSNFIQC